VPEKAVSIGIHVNVNSGNRFIMLHVQTNTAFVHNAKLVDKAGYTTDHGHEECNFQNCADEKLIPNFSCHVAIVLNNQPITASRL
jgi:hypothetical protein